jgi:RPA family protein
MEGEFKKRYTAYKLPIGMIVQGAPQLEKTENGERLSFLNLDGKEINRVNIIATVVDRYESEQKNYVALTIDDGTNDIRVKTFSDSTELLKNIQLGDTVIVIGLVRYYNDEIYIQPDIIRHVDPRWLLARKLELESDLKISYEEITAKNEDEQPVQQQSQSTKPSDEIETVEEKIEAEKAEPVSLREEILMLIKDSEAREGIGIDEIIMKMSQPVEEIKNAVTDLLEAGEIFEPRPGRLRIL